MYSLSLRLSSAVRTVALLLAMVLSASACSDSQHPAASLAPSDSAKVEYINDGSPAGISLRSDLATGAQGPAFWLMPDSGVTLVGGYLSSWGDASLNGMGVSSVPTPERPAFIRHALAGRSAMRFDGGRQKLTIAPGFGSATALSLSLSYRPATNGANAVLLAFGNGAVGATANNFTLQRAGSSDTLLIVRTVGTNTTSLRLAGGFASGVARFLEITSDGTGATTATLDGATVVSGTLSPFGAALRTKNVLGASNITGTGVPFAGDVGDLITYQRHLPSADKAGVQSYFAPNTTVAPVTVRASLW